MSRDSTHAVAADESAERIATVRRMAADYAKAAATPKDEFGGDRTLYMLNIEAVLGGFAVGLADEVEALRAAIGDVRAASSYVEHLEALAYRAQEWAEVVGDDDVLEAAVAEFHEQHGHVACPECTDGMCENHADGPDAELYGADR